MAPELSADPRPEGRARSVRLSLGSSPLRTTLLAAVVAILYANTLGNGFVWDDSLSAANPRPLLQPVPGSYYRPVTMLTFALDRLVWGERAFGFHLTNVVGHFATAWLLLGLCIGLGMPPRPALAASVLFAAHPLQTEAVAYISGRTDILCALFVVLALRTWFRARRPFDRNAIASAALLLLALLCKETAALVPFVLFAYRERDPRVMPVAPLLAVASWLILFATTGPALRLTGLGERLGAVAGAALTYARLLAWPVDLHLERFTPVEGWAPAATLAAWAILGALVAALLHLARRTEGRMLWPALTAATYAPVSGLLPIYPQIADRLLFTPEHSLYLPLLGLTPLVASSVARSCPPRLRAVVSALLIVVLVWWGSIVIRRNRDWRDEDTLFRHTLAHDPPVARVWFNFGNLRLRAGDNVAAAAVYREALRRSPNDRAAHFNLGIALQRQGDLRGAEEQYARTIALDPAFLPAYQAQAALLAARGEIEVAQRTLEEAQRRGAKE